MTSIAEKQKRARSFGLVAAEYQRGRPGYPPEALTWLLGPEPLEVLDLGAGTGKLTQALLEAGHRVVALEPLAEMRSVLEATAPAARTIDGTAEQVPLPARSVDAVVAGAAFHWFDQAAALAEVARVLGAPGVFGLLGNRFDTSLDWARHLRRLTGSPAIKRPGHWPSPEQLGERFAEVEDRAFAHEQSVNLAGMRDYLTSTSRVAVMAAREREELLAGLDAFWEEEPELRGREQATLRWRTSARRCRGLLVSE
jgi:SAM-dependent methyltransferase